MLFLLSILRKYSLCWAFFSSSEAFTFQDRLFSMWIATLSTQSPLMITDKVHPHQTLSSCLYGPALCTGAQSCCNRKGPTSLGMLKHSKFLSLELKAGTHRPNRWTSEAFGETRTRSETNLFGVFSCVGSFAARNCVTVVLHSDKKIRFVHVWSHYV